MRNTLVNGTSLALLFASVSFGFSIFNLMHSPKIVTFDEKGTIQAFVRQISIQGNVSSNKKEITHRFKLALQGAVNQYIAKNEAVILKPSGVVGGAKDITPDIQRLIASKMRGGGK